MPCYVSRHVTAKLGHGSMPRFQGGRLSALLKIVGLPIAVMNALSGIVGVVWLLILWDWKPLLLAGSLLTLSTLGANILLAPGMLISLGTGALVGAAGGTRAGAFIGSALSNAWVVLVETAWCAWILWAFRPFATEANLVPLLLVTYNVATGVWTYMAQRDGGPASMIGAIFVQAACIVAIGMIVFLWSPLPTVALAFGSIMAAGYLCNMVLAIAIAREAAR